MRAFLSATLALALLCAGAAGAAPAEQEKLKDPPPQWLKRGEFKGKRILFASWWLDATTRVPKVLEQMGFTVDVPLPREHLPALEKYDQVWVVSGCGQSNFDDSDAAKLKAYAARGKGVYVLADNAPCTHEANVVGRALHQISLEGDYPGEQMIHVVAPGMVEKMVAEAQKSGDLGKLAELRRAGYLNGKLYAEDHELLSGIERIYEGVTICHLSDSPQLEVILRASDNQSLVAVSKKPGENLLYDCGFTRTYYRWEEHADTATRWYQNVAAYLAGKRRQDLPAPAPTPATAKQG
jgi:hypothetical protein